jgi:phenylalanyl-tRNA synthetase beta chain
MKEFVDVAATPAELRERLSLSGVAVDAIEETSAGPVLDAEITNNRPDCLGHLGVAREVAAAYRLGMKQPDPNFREASQPVSEVVRVDIESPELCGRYTARVIRGVNVQPSPLWLRERLAAMDQQSINNVVDVTNYVLYELGQPLHAFDFNLLAGRHIVVRCACPGEVIRTLDGLERKLTPEMCVIADAGHAVAVAGVMGGAESQIGFNCHDVLIESAWFSPLGVRRAARALGLRTEASVRFERGADPDMAEMASRRAAEIIQQVAGGEILAGVIDHYPGRKDRPAIELTQSEIVRVMGAEIPPGEIESILCALGFELAAQGAGTWLCIPPSWRHDVTREVDLIEEAARHYGFEKFPPRLPPARQPASRLPHAEAEARLRERLVGLGYQEIVTIPLVDSETDALFRPDGVVPAIVTNPLSEDASVMRTSGIPGMLHTIEWNVNRGEHNLRFFEIGKAYELRSGTPIETRILTLGLTGNAREKDVYDSPREIAFGDLKGDLEALGSLTGGWHMQDGGPDCLSSGRRATVALALDRGNAIGVAGQLAKRASERFKLRQDVFLAETRFEELLVAWESLRAGRRFVPLPRFPAAERDFSLLIDDGRTFSDVVDAVRSVSIEQITAVEPVDIFRGAGVPAGKHSLLVRVRFQSSEATLTEAQLTEFSSKIVAAIESRVGAMLRGV